jgi:uncharacterized circularly permuted ATP-grasp superfamily protein/uncharacterized alpha-E superfamily protein
MRNRGVSSAQDWNEAIDASGQPRETYQSLIEYLDRLGPAELRDVEEYLDATLRELGVTFELPTNGRRNTWFCDLLPQIFERHEWDRIVRGFQQRIRAFELFLKDIYGEREILRQRVVPIPLVLGSPNFQRAAVGLPATRQHYLHLSGICLCRNGEGNLQVKNHYFSHASGLSYMIQNRRLLARVLPEIFQQTAIESIADIPTEIMLGLRSVTDRSNPSSVLLSPGINSAVYSEHSFLARRMGIPLVQGGDLVALHGALFLRTVAGLERVDVVYTRLADPWLDPLVFRTGSRLGVPGMIQCVRKGNLALVNSVGAQLADDRSLLHWADSIIRFYLGEISILPTIPTYWLGDLDQREMVLEKLDQFQFRMLTGERALMAVDDQSASEIRLEARRSPFLWVAQPRADAVHTVSYVRGHRTLRRQDHIIYGMRGPESFNVFPGALTRVSADLAGRTESEHGGGGKDTWVMRDSRSQLSRTVRFRRSIVRPGERVTSRVAESFYWLGRYIERAFGVAKMVQAIEAVEMEELNATERKLCRPVWDQLLPSLDSPKKRGRRSIANVAERYRVMLDTGDSGSVSFMIGMGLTNADSLREVISPEAWVSLTALRSLFQRNRFREGTSEADARRITRRLADTVVSHVPQFFATAQLSMLANDGWRFGEIGQVLERAVSTANDSFAIIKSVCQRVLKGQPVEIELSAFLRLLGARDPYRRIYQTRSEPAPVLELLWQNKELSRSVTWCLSRCADLLSASLPPNSSIASGALNFIDDLRQRIRRVDFYAFFGSVEENDLRVLHEDELMAVIQALLFDTGQVHHVIADNFLNHQTAITEPEPTLL